MTKAKVNGTRCTILEYFYFNGFLLCRVKYDAVPRPLPVLASLIEVEYEQI